MEHKDETKFTHFDYGEEENTKKYGKPEPPEYALYNVEIPIYMYFGNNDLLCTKDNVELLASKLKNSKIRELDLYGHLTFFWSKSIQ